MTESLTSVLIVIGAPLMAWGLYTLAFWWSGYRKRKHFERGLAIMNRNIARQHRQMQDRLFADLPVHEMFRRDR